MVSLPQSVFRQSLVKKWEERDRSLPLLHYSPRNTLPTRLYNKWLDSLLDITTQQPEPSLARPPI